VLVVVVLVEEEEEEEEEGRWAESQVTLRPLQLYSGVDNKTSKDDRIQQQNLNTGKPFTQSMFPDRQTR
jgi:hypothetical protein